MIRIWEYNQFDEHGGSTEWPGSYKKAFIYDNFARIFHEDGTQEIIMFNILANITWGPDDDVVVVAPIAVNM